MQTVNAVLPLEVLNRTHVSCYRHGAKANGFGKKKAGGARAKKAGHLIGIELLPYDLRRHAATYASRVGAPLEIVSKVILPDANLSTTQRYPGKVSDAEAIQ